MRGFIEASAHRFLARCARRKRTLREKEAYLEGMFDAHISNEEQAAVEAILFPNGERK